MRTLAPQSVAEVILVCLCCLIFILQNKNQPTLCTKCILLFSGCGSPSHRCSWVKMQRSFFLPAHLQKQDGWWISWKSNFYFSGPVLFYAFPCFLVNHHFPRGTAEKIKVGKASLKRTIFFDIFLFTTKTERSREMRNTDWFIGVLFKRYRMERWRKTSSVSAPLRSWLNSVLLEKQMQGVPPELVV